jgi:hypothetical protein
MSNADLRNFHGELEKSSQENKLLSEELERLTLEKEQLQALVRIFSPYSSNGMFVLISCLSLRT